MAIWYVRPNASHGATRNGTSYATAWGGWAEVNGDSMAATDTLMVCGAHTYASVISMPKAGTSATARFTIDGGYLADPGSIVFTSAAFLNANQNYVEYKNIPISGVFTSIIYLSNTGCKFNTLTIANGTTGILFSSSTGIHFADTEIEKCTIYGQTGAAINWLVSIAGALSTITNLSIRNCTIYGQTGINVINLRTTPGVDAGSLMVNVQIQNNTIRDASGVALRIAHAGTTSVGGPILVSGNTFSNLTEAAGNLGGAISITSVSNVVAKQNNVRNVAGVYGGCNLIYCINNLVEENIIDGCTTGSIDANGILIDHSSNYSTVRRNRIFNCDGKAGVVNSGCGVMVLDAEHVKVYANYIEGGRIGIYFGDASATQQVDVNGNTVIDSTVYGVYVKNNATRANLVLKNNVFIGSVPFVYDNATGGWTGEDYNAIWGMTASVNHTDGAHNITADPLLTSDYRPTPSSPLLGAGTHLGYTRDVERKQRPNPPSIGAYDVATLRTP